MDLKRFLVLVGSKLDETLLETAPVVCMANSLRQHNTDQTHGCKFNPPLLVC